MINNSTHSHHLTIIYEGLAIYEISCRLAKGESFLPLILLLLHSILYLYELLAWIDLVRLYEFLLEEIRYSFYL